MDTFTKYGLCNKLVIWQTPPPSTAHMVYRCSLTFHVSKKMTSSGRGYFTYDNKPLHPKVNNRSFCKKSCVWRSYSIALFVIEKCKCKMTLFKIKSYPTLHHMCMICISWVIILSICNFTWIHLLGTLMIKFLCRFINQVSVNNKYS